VFALDYYFLDQKRCDTGEFPKNGPPECQALEGTPSERTLCSRAERVLQDASEPTLAERRSGLGSGHPGQRPQALLQREQTPVDVGALLLLLPRVPALTGRSLVIARAGYHSQLLA
jgi:hypothetical protein